MQETWLFELIGIEGPLKGLKKLLTDTITSFGRESTSTILFDKDALVSRSHAHIIFLGGSYYLEDQKSLNGTRLNGKKVQSRIKLSLGDRIRIGKSSFLLRLPSSGLEILRDTQIINRPHSLLLKSPLHSEKRQSERKLPKLLIKFSILLVASFFIVKKPELTASASQTTPKNYELSELPSSESERAEKEISHIDHEYQSYTSQHQWGHAFFTALWALAWNPSHHSFQSKVIESGEKLSEPTFLISREHTVRHTLKIARKMYLEQAPLRVSQILTQALLDFRLYEGLTEQAYFEKEIRHLNTLASQASEDGLSAEKAHIDELISKREIASAREETARLLAKYPLSRELKDLWASLQSE